MYNCIYCIRKFPHILSVQTYSTVGFRARDRHHLVWQRQTKTKKSQTNKDKKEDEGEDEAKTRKLRQKQSVRSGFIIIPLLLRGDYQYQCISLSISGSGRISIDYHRQSGTLQHRYLFTYNLPL